jgi:hypothetical protein
MAYDARPLALLWVGCHRQERPVALPLAVRAITTAVFAAPPLVAGILLLIHRRPVTARA